MPTYKQSEPQQSGKYFVEPGVYRVEIENAVEKRSQAGNEMIKLVCRVVLPDGTLGPEIWDHLVFTPKAAWKIDQFLASIGQAVVAGEEVNIDAGDLIGQTALAEIGEEPGQTNPDHRFNTIERWLFGSERSEWLESNRRPGDPAPVVKKAEPPKKAAKTEKSEDDIPF